ncbi:MAG: alpha-hydroxy-acid oxidizing protein [Acidimicrobiia bacterium]|nr:alpha-hydroxy-acid oxidizing protein [Acidimicrobiia bacterium]
MDLTLLEGLAKGNLTPGTYDYYAGGADDELTLADNVAAWQRMRLRPRVLRDVSEVDTATTVLGTPVSMPVLVAPTAYHKLAHPEGEIATARAAAGADTLMIASTLATTSLEDIAASIAAPRWFQLYVHRDQGMTESLIERAVGAGYEAIVLTVDLAVLGHRPRDERNAFSIEGHEMANLQTGTPDSEGSGLAAYADSAIDPGLTFEHIEWISSLSGLPVLVKGIVRGDDASAAVDAGAAGIMVSNHGGRQLDTCIATADALEEVAAAVAGRAEVYVDGGVRRGTDVVKALALGARAVLVGRPILWGLAVDGASGVADVLEFFRDATARAMALCGVSSVAEIDRSLVV